MKKIYVKDSPIEGNGIFANKNIRKGEIISYFKGKHYKRVTKGIDDALSNPNSIGIGPNHWMETEPPLMYTNHSCNPNASLKGTVTLIAIKNILKNQEILMDYSITEADPLWYMKCTCGLKDCRKKIKSVQYLPKDIFKKYLPYVTKYFQKIYLKFHV